ncbi:MAG: hypothetical protein Kow0063_26730 [Anaerolineae bacterium]
MLRRLLLPVLLGLIGFGLFFTSLAVAASEQPVAPPGGGPQLPLGDPITDTDSISPTTSISHPVASAIAEYFEVDYSEIATLHEEGLGFGVIAHAYFIAGTLGISPTDVLAEFQAGTGWGEILKEYGLHPGLAGRGGNLGSIMSGRAQMLPPGQLKRLSPNQADTFVPPGQLKKHQGEGPPDLGPAGHAGKPDEDKGGGPPGSPPGHGKDKGDKGKKH